MTYKYPDEELLVNYLDSIENSSEISSNGHRMDYILCSERFLGDVLSVDIFVESWQRSSDKWHLPINLNFIPALHIINGIEKYLP